MKRFLAGVTTPVIKIEDDPLLLTDGANKKFVDDEVNALSAKLVPSGGTTGQVLTKDTATDHDVSWQTPSAGGGSTFGSEYAYHESLAVLSYIDATNVWHDKDAWNIVVTTAGYFHLDWMYNWNHNSSNTNQEFNVVHTLSAVETVLSMIVQEPQEVGGTFGSTGSSQRYLESGFNRVYLAVGTHTFTFRMRSTTDAYASSMWDLKTAIWRIS